MPQVVKQDIDALNLSITVTLTKEELKKRYNQDITRYQRKAAIKGFRAGKTPEMVIKKMFGDQLFADAINDLIGKAMGDFIESEKIALLGQPLPAEDSPKNTAVSHTKIDELVFKFDIGRSPQFEPQGVSKNDIYERILPEIEDKWVEEGLMADRNKKGERTSIEDSIEDKDIVRIAVKEIDGTIESEFSVLVEMLEDDANALFKQHKKDDSFHINIFQLEKDSTEERVRRYFLNLEDESVVSSDMYTATVLEVTRVTPATLNEEFFTSTYGETVTDEAGARAYISKEYTKFFEGEGFGLLVRTIQTRLMELNQIELPDAFLKRWLKSSSEKNTDEIVEKGYEAFARNLRWDLVRDHVSEKFDIFATEEDIIGVFKERVQEMYGGGQGFDDKLITMLAKHVMDDTKKNRKKDYNQAVDSAQFVKFFKVIVENVTIENKSIPMEAYNNIRNAAMASAAQEREASASGHELTDAATADYEDYEEVK